jgi:uncharacterized OsmC-like protein
MNSTGEAIRNATAYLTAHPDEARYTDSAAVATLEDGLKVNVKAPDGRTVTTDMVKSVGGTDTAPSPGWLYRAALASADATLIAMRAAMVGVELTSVDVTVDSESNDFGILGIDESVPPGPLSVRTRVRVEAKDADEPAVRDIVEWAVAHSTVSDATRRAVPMSLEIETAD